MKRLITGMVIVSLIYMIISFINGGLTYNLFITMPLVYILLAIYLPSKKDLK